MPNWCENTLWVDGEPKDIKRFRKEAKSKEYDLTLSKLHPMPEALKNTDAESSKPNWYDWCIKNWGTKWDVEGKLTWEDDDFLEFFFPSAWSPPITWLKNVSQKYPSLNFRLKYYEPNMRFMGVASAENGKVQDTCY